MLNFTHTYFMFSDLLYFNEIQNRNVLDWILMLRNNPKSKFKRLATGYT